jgi:hypothetical protein
MLLISNLFYQNIAFSGCRLVFGKNSNPWTFNIEYESCRLWVGALNSMFIHYGSGAFSCSGLVKIAALGIMYVVFSPDRIVLRMLISVTFPSHPDTKR